MNLTSFYRHSLYDFNTVLRSLGVFHVTSHRLRVHDLEMMVTLTRKVCALGNKVAIDFSCERTFDACSQVYRKKDYLYLAFYEQDDRLNHKQIHGVYLKFKPDEMLLVGNPRDPTQNRIWFRTLSYDPLPASTQNSIVGEDGLQVYLSRDEPNPVQGREEYHVIASVCGWSKVLLHPHGSVFDKELRKLYF